MMKVFKLLHDYEHLDEMDFEAVCEDFKGIDTIGFNMIGIDNFTIPEKIFLRANFNVIPSKTDFPITDLTFPIFSKKLIEATDNIRPFKKNYLKTIMIDDTFKGEYKGLNNEIYQEVRYDDSYVGIQFLEFTDAFDYQNSVFKKMKSNPTLPGVINKLILKEPINGFPALFKIKENMSYIFVSEVAKYALETNNIKGCLFEEIETL